MENEINPANFPFDHDIKDLLTEGTDTSAVELEDDYDEMDLSWQKARRYALDTKLRVGLARWIQWLISIWLLLVMAVLVLSMFCGRIESSVLIALLTTTTVNILGLPFIILKGLFDK
jgi:hypothetical protein